MFVDVAGFVCAGLTLPDFGLTVAFGTAEYVCVGAFTCDGVGILDEVLLGVV
ncbi:hypothetical protein ACQCN2_01875 [Brevibacillus ginsengisoli]|uniref:hypothetical protein n=1 Tax=Brevibacillus ginsengisoli TaxID=363854 RepID=UPI003CF1F93C